MTSSARRKPALRQAVRTRRQARRRALTPGRRAQDSLAIAEAAQPLWAGVAPGCVAAYVATASEPPTDVLIERALAAGLRVILPELRRDKNLDWREVEADGRAGALLGPDAIAGARVIVVPALAVDRAGTRLGQGGGSYDRALVRRSPGSTVVAVVNDDELVGEPLPAEPHDSPVDAVITPAGALVRLRAPAPWTSPG